VRCARLVLTTPDPEERVVSRLNFRSFVALRTADLGTMIQLSYFIPVCQWTCPSEPLNYSVNCRFRRRCWRGFLTDLSATLFPWRSRCASIANVHCSTLHISNTHRTTVCARHKIERMWHIPLLRDNETLGGLSMYYPFRVPLRSVIEDTLSVIGYR